MTVDRTWQAVKKQSDRIAQARTVKALKRAEKYLLDCNASMTYRRCTGVLKTDALGLPTFGYCRSYECWKCGRIRVWLDIERLTAGLLKMRSAWFVTLTLADTHKPTNSDADKSDFTMSVNQVMHNLRITSKRNKHTLKYCTYYGYKESGQLHAHNVASWLPDAVYSHQRKVYNKKAKRWVFYDVYVSEWLKSTCERVGIDCHIERVKKIDDVARYLRSNIETTLHNFPPERQRVRFNNRWVKEQDVNDMVLNIYNCLECGQVRYARTDNDHPARCKCGNKSRWTSPVKKYVNQDEIHNLLLYTHHFPNKQQISPSIHTTPTPTKACTKCGVIHPLTSDYWQVNSHSRSGYKSACKACISEYDKKRDSERNNQFERLCKIKAMRANKSARGYGLSGVVNKSDVIAQYVSQSGKCAYCSAELSDGFDLEHYQALVNGGTNARANIRCACSQCNRRKGSKSIRQWQSILASQGIRLSDTPDTMPIAIELPEFSP